MDANKKEIIDKILAKKMLFDIADVLEEIGLQFFLSDGTCLGAYREKDFIEYDNDVDLKAKAEDFVPKYPLLVEKIKEKGYGIWKGKFPFRRVSRMSVREGAFHVDITSLYLIGNERWLPGKKHSFVYPARLFENPDQINFLGRWFNIPTPVTEYLTLTYEFDYMTPKLATEYKRSKELFGKFDASKVPEELR